MEKYENLRVKINKTDTAEYKGLGNEVSFGPICGFSLLPIELSRFGITYPDKDYRIKRSPSTLFVLEYVVSGSGYLNINGEKYKVSAGDAYLIHQGDYCEYYADADDPYKKYWVNFTSRKLISEFISAYGITERVIHGIDLTEYFEEIFELEKISNLNENIYLHFSRIIYSILHDIALKKQKNSQVQSFDIAISTKNILKESIQHPITVNEIAKRLYRSKNDIISQFKKRYGTTPYAYLISLRIEFAKDLLTNSKQSIAEIAERLCFSSEYHFSSSFKAKVGISPLKYRKGAKDK